MKKELKELHAKLRELGCIICQSPTSIHHAFTSAGGRRDDSKVIPLCPFHHVGEQGFHELKRRKWEPKYGTEYDLMAKAYTLVGMEHLLPVDNSEDACK